MTTRSDPQSNLNDGCQVLGAVLGPAGFRFVDRGTGKGSGGHFARGAFVSGSRVLEFSLRFSLGEVVYRWDDLSLTHAELMWAIQVRGSYPGFGDDPLDGFRHLASDLSGPLAPFVEGDDKEWFSEAVKFVREHPESRLP